MLRDSPRGGGRKHQTYNNNDPYSYDNAIRPRRHIYSHRSRGPVTAILPRLTGVLKSLLADLVPGHFQQTRQTEFAYG